MSSKLEPSDFQPMHNGERFHVRKLGPEWQVYAKELTHIAFCDSPDFADMVAKCLNNAAEGVFQYKVTGEGIKPREVCDE